MPRGVSLRPTVAAYILSFRGPHRRTIRLLADRASAHTDRQTQTLATAVNIRFVWLPTQTPGLSAMDRLWGALKAVIAANRQTPTIDVLAISAMLRVLMLSPSETKREAGTLSPNFWLRQV